MQSLQAPISLEEIKLAILHTKGNTSPGSDGLTMEFCKSFVEDLAQKLERLFNLVLQEKQLPDSWNDANIILLPKPHKDLKKVESYRPIARLNAGYKILTSILAKRLNSVIGCLIHPDQTGFIKNRQLRDNTRKVLNIIDFAVNKKIPMVLFSLTLKKHLIE